MRVFDVRFYPGRSCVPLAVRRGYDVGIAILSIVGQSRRMLSFDFTDPSGPARIQRKYLREFLSRASDHPSAASPREVSRVLAEMRRASGVDER